VGENWVVRRGTIGLFPGSTNFCQCFIGYFPWGGKLGCSAGNNRVLSRQRKFWQKHLNYFIITWLIESNQNLSYRFKYNNSKYLMRSYNCNRDDRVRDRIKFIIIVFDQWYKEDQTQVLPTYGVFSYVYNHYNIILRMHKKTRKIKFYHII
jgi:hypothetical protein